MGRRRSSLLDDLAEAPWWAGVILGIAGYLLIAYGAPAFASGNLLLEGMSQSASRVLAPLWLVLCLIGAGLSAFKAWQTRRLYDKQQGKPNLASLSWQAFERLVGEHFRRRGYQVRETGGSRPDGGIDLIVVKAEERYVVQCKHWKARQIGVSVIRELVGSITQSGAAGGFLVTSGTLTDPARKLAQEAGVDVVDGTTLRAELGHQDDLGGINRKAESAAPSGPPTCPVCRNRMVLRTARRGDQAGQKFWGCSSFPSCRCTRPLSP